MSPLLTATPSPKKTEDETPDVLDQLGIPRHGGTGQPKIYAEDEYELPEKKRKGQWYSRTTSWIDVLDDRSMLEEWKCRMVADGLLRHEPSLAEKFLALSEPFDKDRGEANKIVGLARAAADKARKADLGNALHDIYERIGKGQDPGFVPPEYEADVAAFIDALDKAGLEIVGTEVFGVNDDWQMAGTLDQFLRDREGRVYVGDIKTGRMDFAMGKTTRQVAAYAGYRRYDPVTFKRSPLLDGVELQQDTGFLVASAAGTGKCIVRKLDLVRGRLDLQLAWEVREYRKLWGRKAWKNPPVVASSGLSPEELSALDL